MKHRPAHVTTHDDVAVYVRICPKCNAALATRQDMEDKMAVHACPNPECFCVGMELQRAEYHGDIEALFWPKEWQTPNTVKAIYET